MRTQTWLRRVLASSVGAVSVFTWTLGVVQPARAASSTAVPSAASAASATASTPGATASASAGVTIPPPAKGTTTVADDGTLRLDVNMGTGWFEVVDERNGAVWTSGPQNPTQYAQNGYWQDILQSQFDMGTVDISRNAVAGENDMWGQNQWFFQGYFQADLSTKQIPNGVALTYDYTKAAIQYTADLTIQGAHLIVTIPGNQIYEALNPKTGAQLPLGSPLGCHKYPQPKPQNLISLYFFPPECWELTSIATLPALGAGHPGTGGYAVIPDGSGAEIAFNAQHPIYTDQFAQPVYGDTTVTPNADSWLPQANLPLYGIVHSNAQDPTQSSAMLGLITKGAGQAYVESIPAGQRSNLYLSFFKFVYRPKFNALGIGDVQALQYFWNPVLGDRQATYYFLDGSQANYAGLALKYRQLLMQNEHLQPLKNTGNPPLLLQVMNGIREIGVLFAPFERMTTFSQTAQMLQTLHNQGVTSVRVALEGWMANGYQWKTLPKIWPPDGRLGGTGGLRQLTSEAKSLGDQVVVAMDLYHAYPGGPGYNVRADTLYQESQLPLSDYGALGNTYLLSPAFVEQKELPRLLQDLKRIGVSGVDFQYLARNVYPQLAKKHPLSRDQAEVDLMAMVSAAQQQLGTAGVQGGNGYAIGPSQYFYNAPVSDSGFNYETESIPFWEIVVHGLALYSGRESNLLSSPVQQNLQMIEDGALPVWELTWQSASNSRFTSYNYLYSSQFSHWEPAAVAQYKQEVQKGYAALAYVAITGSGQVQPGVNVTDYANGAHVIVNFNNTAVTLPQYGNITVPAQDYKVIPGGGGQ